MKLYHLCLLLSLVPQISAAKSEQDLLILVLFDALRADHVHSYGYERQTRVR